jgi:Icc protein
MISRRQFIKRLLAFVAVLAGGGAVWNSLLNEEQPLQGLPGPASLTDPQTDVQVSHKPLLSFFLLSDLHISDGIATMTDKLHAALKDVSHFESPVEFIVLGGDLTDMGRETDYKLLRKVLSGYKLPPLYANMGNHDYYDIWIDKNGDFAKETMPNGKTDAMAKERFMNFFGYKEHPYVEFWAGGSHIILMSQEVYVGEKPEVGEGAWYSDAQLAWLADTMKQHEDGKPAIVFIHQPLPAPDMDGRPHQMIRAREFRAILKPYRNVFVLSGHTHRNFATENHYNRENSFHWFNNASVGKTRDTQNSEIAQGMYVQVFPHQVVVRGREFSDRSWIESANYTVQLQDKA